MKALGFMDRLYMPRLFRFILLVCFLANLGLVEAVLDSILQSPTKTKGLPIEQEMENERTLVNFIREKTKLAREKDAQGAYSPYDYFGDLQKISDMKKELGGNRTTIYPYINEMCSLSEKSFKKGFTEQDLIIAREKYENHVDPGRVSREESIKHLSEIGWSGVLSWFFWVYVKSFILAAVLFLIWINGEREEDYEEREERFFSIRNPAGFVLALVLYPVVILSVMWKWIKYTGKGVYIEAELRRTKKRLFALLSEDEISRIRRFVKSGLPVSAWREQLIGQGLVFRHSLALALLVTIIVVIIPRPGETRTGDLSRAEPGPYIAVEQALGSHLARMQIDEGQDDDSGGFPYFLVSGFQEAILLPVCLFRLVKKVFRIGEIPKRIDHVPRRGLFGLRPVLAAN